MGQPMMPVFRLLFGHCGRLGLFIFSVFHFPHLSAGNDGVHHEPGGDSRRLSHIFGQDYITELKASSGEPGVYRSLFFFAGGLWVDISAGMAVGKS